MEDDPMDGGLAAASSGEAPMSPVSVASGTGDLRQLKEMVEARDKILKNIQERLQDAYANSDMEAIDFRSVSMTCIHVCDCWISRIVFADWYLQDGFLYLHIYALVWPTVISSHLHIYMPDRHFAG